MPAKPDTIMVRERTELISAVQRVDHLQDRPVHLVRDLLRRDAFVEDLLHAPASADSVARNQGLKQVFDKKFLVHVTASKVFGFPAVSDPSCVYALSCATDPPARSESVVEFVIEPNRL